jgi:hypothetical protein
MPASSTHCYQKLKAVLSLNSFNSFAAQFSAAAAKKHVKTSILNGAKRPW